MSDGRQEARRLQPRRFAAVRRSAWLGAFSCVRHGSSSENVTPSGLLLNIEIRFSLYNLLNFKSGFAEESRHLGGTEKKEVNADLMPPPFIQMFGVVANVQGQQQQTARSQNSPKLTQRPRHGAMFESRATSDCSSSACNEFDVGSPSVGTLNSVPRF